MCILLVCVEQKVEINLSYIVIKIGKYISKCTKLLYMTSYMQTCADHCSLVFF